MKSVRYPVLCCSLAVTFCLWSGRAHADVTGGLGVGPLMFRNAGTETALGISSFASLAWPIANGSRFLLDFEMTFSAKANLVGLSLFVGAGFQQRAGPVHLGFGPGLLAGGWILTPDDDCEEDYSCVGGVAGIAGFAVSAEIGYAIAQPDGRRLDLIIRAVANPNQVTHGVRLVQLYLGIRISE